jgi:hypothetical protein
MVTLSFLDDELFCFAAIKLTGRTLTFRILDDFRISSAPVLSHPSRPYRSRSTVAERRQRNRSTLKQRFAINITEKQNNSNLY